MRRRSTLSMVAATLVLTGVVAGVVALPGTGQAAGSKMRSHTSSKKVPLFYLSLGDFYSVGYQPGMVPPPGTPRWWP
jgi:hypothetical protein